MSEHDNPYRSPSVQVVDYLPADRTGSYQAPARKVPAGRGSAWVGEAWRLFKAQPALWFCAFLIFVAVSFICNMIPFLGSLLSTLIAPMLSVGLLAFGRRQALTGEADLGELFAAFRSDKMGSLFILALIYLALMIVMIIASVILFIVVAGGAGVLSQMGSEAEIASVVSDIGGLWLALGVLVFSSMTLLVLAAYWFAPGLIFYGGLQPAAAMKESFDACLRNWLPMLVYSLVLTGVFLLGAIPLFLGWLVVVPLAMATMYTSFEDLFGRG